MPARNDSSAVAKAAKAVDREAMAAVVRSLLADRLPRTQPALPESMSLDQLYRELEDAKPSQPSSPMTGSGPVGPLRSGRRKSPQRTDAATLRKLVERTSFGRMPRYGTARYEKAHVVTQRLRELAGQAVIVKMLVGLPYAVDGKSGRITYHDLEVMADKGLIYIKENVK